MSGQITIVKNLALKYGIPYGRLKYRLYVKNMTIAEAVNAPVNTRGGSRKRKNIGCTDIQMQPNQAAKMYGCWYGG